MNEPDAAGGESDDDEIWRDLVARFDGQVEGPQGAAPWPERENLRTSLHGELHGEPPADPPEPKPGPGAVPPVPGADGLPREPDPVPEQRDTGRAFTADGPVDDDDHFIPPPPPPLPRLEPLLKGAWLALFGGPAYLLVATAAGWSVPGWGAFAAMAAFVAGFVILVLHLGNDRRDNGSDSDDGAVV